MDARETEHIYYSWIDSEEFDDENLPTEVHPYWERACSLISGEDPSGLSEVDTALILGSRVYGEKLKDVANRLRITYGTARTRRNRAERKLKEYWVKFEKKMKDI